MHASPITCAHTAASHSPPLRGLTVRVYCFGSILLSFLQAPSQRGHSSTPCPATDLAYPEQSIMKSPRPPLSDLGPQSHLLPVSDPEISQLPSAFTCPACPHGSTPSHFCTSFAPSLPPYLFLCICSTPFPSRHNLATFSLLSLSYSPLPIASTILKCVSVPTASLPAPGSFPSSLAPVLPLVSPMPSS